MAVLVCNIGNNTVDKSRRLFGIATILRQSINKSLVLYAGNFVFLRRIYAGVAELADALDSKSSVP